MAARVLLALPDDPGPLADALRAAGHGVEVCPPARLRAVATAFQPAVCVVELGKGELPGPLVELLGSSRAPALVALLAPAAAAGAAAALERGVEAVLPREASAEWVRAAVQAAAARRAAAAELAARREVQQRADAVVLLGKSAAVRRLREGLERVASTPRTTVLVTAATAEEGGAVARLVHARSARQSGPLAELHGGTRLDLDEAEALGPGGELLARAEGGTLLLHDVARLGPLAQLALARALDERGEQVAGPDVRFVATSRVDLESEVQAGRFREELLYRLNVLTLPVPPLAERAEDLAELSRILIERAAGPGRAGPRLAAEAHEELRRRPWPGGLRQLRLTLEAALLGCEAPVLGAERIAAAPSGHPGEPGHGRGSDVLEALATPGARLELPDRSLRSAEEALIRQVLAETGGNKLRSAEILGIHRTTLYHKLRDYRIEA